MRPGAVAAVATPSGGAPVPRLPPGLVVRIAKAGAKVADQWGRNRVKAAAVAADVPEKLAAPVIDSAALNPEMADLFGELAPHALAEHGMDPSVSPTGCMVAIAGMWLLGVQQAVAAMKAAAPQPEPKAFDAT